MIGTIYICIGWNFFQHIVTEYGLIEFEGKINPDSGRKIFGVYNTKTMIIRGLFLMGFTLLLQPLVLQRNLSGLRYAAGLKFLIVGYILCIVIIQTPFYVSKF